MKTYLTFNVKDCSDCTKEREDERCFYVEFCSLHYITLDHFMSKETASVTAHVIIKFQYSVCFVLYL